MLGPTINHAWHGIESPPNCYYSGSTEYYRSEGLAHSPSRPLSGGCAGPLLTNVDVEGSRRGRQAHERSARGLARGGRCSAREHADHEMPKLPVSCGKLRACETTKVRRRIGMSSEARVGVLSKAQSRDQPMINQSLNLSVNQRLIKVTCLAR